MAKTDWKMGDTVLPEDMNQIGQEINDAATAAAAAQAKADQAEVNAKEYADDNFLRVIKLPVGGTTTVYTKIAEMTTNIGSGRNGIILFVNGVSDYGASLIGSDVLQMTTRNGANLRVYSFVPYEVNRISYGFVNNTSTGKTEIWLRRGSFCHPTEIIVTKADLVTVGILSQQTSEPSGITYVNKDAFATKNQESWINATLLNSWINYGSGWAPASYFKDQLGIVRLRGMIRNGTVTQGTTILILPSGYRPASDISFLVPCGDGTSDILGRLVVDTSGNVRVSSASNYYLDLSGISFRTA